MGIVRIRRGKFKTNVGILKHTMIAYNNMRIIGAAMKGNTVPVLTAQSSADGF